MNKISRTIAVGAAAALALAAFAGPAAAHRGKGWGKKAMGTIASFDGTTLTVTATDGSTITATFTEETRVKVEHRGHHDRSGNPSHGDATDLTAGAFVLKMKTDDDGSLDHLRIRPATHATEEDSSAGEEAGADTGTDAGTDAGTDTGTDAGTDTGTDAGTDTGTGDSATEDTGATA